MVLMMGMMVITQQSNGKRVNVSVMNQFNKGKEMYHYKDHDTFNDVIIAMSMIA